MHRNPSLNKDHSNVHQLMSWAMFCQPENDWFDLEALGSLSKSCKVICSKHFEESMYTSVAKIRLHRHAVPTLHENDENHPNATAPSLVGNRTVLGVHGQILSGEYKTTAQPLIKIQEDNSVQQMVMKEEINIPTPSVSRLSFPKEDNSVQQKVMKEEINIPTPSVSRLSFPVLHECFKSGVHVVATVCDMDGVNVKALENLGSTVESPYFNFEGEEVITLPDPPHLLKCFRNLFMTYDVKLPLPVHSTTVGCSTGTGVASWSHVRKFYEVDNCNPNFVYAPKLSTRHIQPNGKEKMRVYLAAQVFSHSVAMGIHSKASTNELPAESIATAVFLEHMNNLFDLVNANAPDRQQGKPYKTNLRQGSPHIEYFKKSLQLISVLEFVGCKRKPPSQSGWLKLLRGYERLWDNLNKKFKINSIATRRINQDPLENFFGCIRANCGSNDNPTVGQFIAGLKTAIITNMRNLVKSKRNCEDDNSELLDNFNQLFSNNDATKIKICYPLPEPIISEQDISVSDEDILEIESLSEMQACAYVCGFIFKKYSQDCNNCKKAMLADNPSIIHQFVENKEYVEGKHSLKYANNEFIACVEISADLVNNYIKEHSHLKNIKQESIKIIREIVNYNFLNSCSEHLNKNINMIEQSVTIILIKRFCLLENRKFATEYTKKSLAKKIKILKNS